MLAYKWDSLSDDWLNDGKLTYAYDAGGNQTVFFNYYWDKTGEQWVGSLKYEYTFDDNGNRITETGWDWDEDGGKWIYNQRRTHYYQGQSSLDQNISATGEGMMLYPNPAAGNITVLTGHRGLHVLQLLDMSAKEILLRIFQGESCDLDLGNLPPSVYFIRITQPGMQPQIVRLVKR